MKRLVRDIGVAAFLVGVVLLALGEFTEGCLLLVAAALALVFVLVEG